MIVHAHISTPGNYKGHRNERSAVVVIHCDVPDRCQLRTRGECVCRQFFGGYYSCKHGRAHWLEGPTHRAAKHWDWLKNAREQYKDAPTLEAPKRRLAIVGDWAWLPYSHMGLVMDRESWFSVGALWIPVADFNAALIAKLCAGRPYAMMGGEIESYQREEVPLFVAHLQELMPELLAEAAALSPRIRELGTVSKVGRQARLATLRAGVGTFATGDRSPKAWTWDGEWIAATDRAAFPPFTPFDAVEVRIKPGPDAVVTITDDGQVGSDTVLLD